MLPRWSERAMLTSPMATSPRRIPAVALADKSLSPRSHSTITGRAAAPTPATGAATLTRARAYPAYRATSPAATPTPPSAPHARSVPLISPTTSNAATSAIPKPTRVEEAVTTTGSARRLLKPPRKSDVPD